MVTGAPPTVVATSPLSSAVLSLIACVVTWPSIAATRGSGVIASGPASTARPITIGSSVTRTTSAPASARRIISASLVRSSAWSPRSSSTRPYSAQRSAPARWSLAGGG